MLSVLRCTDQAQTWLNGSPRTIIDRVFGFKANAHIFIDAVLRHIENCIKYLSANKTTIVRALRDLYVVKYSLALPFPPELELESYVDMLAHELGDWQELRNTTTSDVRGLEIDTESFYRLWDNIGRVAVNKNLPMQRAYLNRVAWAEIDAEIDHKWMTDVICAGSRSSDFTPAELEEANNTEESLRAHDPFRNDTTVILSDTAARSLFDQTDCSI